MTCDLAIYLLTTRQPDNFLSVDIFVSLVLSSRQAFFLLLVIPRLRPGLLSLCSVLSSRQFLLIQLSLYVGDIVAQADVAPLEYSIHFGFLTHNFLIEVKDSTVILAKLLNNLWRYKTTIY